MANTTFSGPVRSENGFINGTKNSSTGAFSANFTIAADGQVDATYSSSDTGTANFEPVVVETTMDGAGGLAGRSRFQLNADAALGSYSNALKAITVYGASGKTTGLGSAVVAEMTMSAGTDAGNYAPVEVELNVPSGAALGTQTALTYKSVNGADASTFDTSGVVDNIQGLTAGSAGESKALNVPGGNFDVTTDVSTGIKIKVGASTFYIPLVAQADWIDN